MQRQKSEATNREKMSLRNLLNMELQSNYRSTTFEIRPKTMYNQRQMKIFQDERMKLMSEQQLHRNNSSQQFARTRPVSVERTIEKTEKNKLKHALGKVNILAQGSIKVSEEERIGSIYKFLQCLSKYFSYHIGTNRLKKNLKLLQNCFQLHILVFQSNCLYWRNIVAKRAIVIFSKNNKQLNAWYRIIDSVRLFNGIKYITYKQLCDELFKEMGKKMTQIQGFRMDCEKRFQQLQTKLMEKTQIVKKLTSEVSFYEDHPSKQQYGYISQLQQKQAQTQIDLKRARSHIKQLQNNVDYLSQYNNMLSQRVEDLRAKIYDYQIVQFSNLNEIQKNSQLKEFQSNVEVLKDLIHKGALRMASMREQYNKIQAYNQQLLGQKSVLAKRAAVGFAQLTPRPNFKKIFQQNGLQFEKIVPEKQKPSTQDLFSSLMKRFKDFYGKHSKVDLKLEFPSNNQGNKKDNPADNIMNGLTKMEKQMRRVEGLSIEVKNGYSRQRAEQQQLEKKFKK